MEVKCIRSESAAYDGFASFYNCHLGRFSERLLPVLDKLVLKRLPPGAAILDLCCGTGQLASLLQERGFSVIGVDESDEMIGLARLNAPGSEFIQADAGSFVLADSVDAAFCTFDSVNHILNINDLQDSFSCVHRHLKEGGYFLFDANMEDGYLSRWSGQWNGTFEGQNYVIRAIYEKEDRVGRNLIEVNGPGYGVTRNWEIHERCYAEGDLLTALRNAGFELTAMYDGHNDLGMYGEWGRRFFVCQKKREGERPCQRVNGRGRETCRSLEACIRDGVCPEPSQRRELGATSRRLDAIFEVLRRLDPPLYKRLCVQATQFSWFVPAADVLGQVQPFPASYRPYSPSPGPKYSRVIYLSPLLEQHDWPIVVVAVAHELAHVILEHEILDPSSETYRLQEAEVDQVLREWGFRDEVEAAEAALSINTLISKCDRDES